MKNRKEKLKELQNLYILESFFTTDVAQDAIAGQIAELEFELWGK